MFFFLFVIDSMIKMHQKAGTGIVELDKMKIDYSKKQLLFFQIKISTRNKK